MLESTTENPLKRSLNLSGLDINDLRNVDLPTKKSRIWRDHMIQSKSVFVPTTATRIIYPLPKPRRFLQATKPSSAPLPTRAEAGRAAGARLRVAMSNRRKKNRSSQLKISKGSGQAAPLAASLDATILNAVSSCNPSVAITTLSAVDNTVFKIHEDMADEEMSNLFTHSTNALDIFKDETQITAKMDRGKENIPHSHAVASISTAISAGTHEDQATHTARKSQHSRVLPCNLQCRFFHHCPGRNRVVAAASTVPPKPTTSSTHLRLLSSFLSNLSQNTIVLPLKRISSPNSPNFPHAA
ncbi:hypothetical protein MMC29_001036 [Sticta canariensis]|nr:hypothetical protein [Sticta canariensis]